MSIAADSAPARPRGLSPGQRVTKRALDLAIAVPALVLLFPVILISWRLAARDTGASGFFRQERVGRRARLFRVIKLRTMRRHSGGTTVTTANDVRITPLGAKLRRWKLDELPQLINVVRGEMSIVGPRPDVPGFLDRLEGADRVLLELRPGMTGPATLKYRNEEEVLAAQPDPERYNAEVIWPDKVRINLEYMRDWSVLGDFRCMIATVRK